MSRVLSEEDGRPVDCRAGCGACCVAPSVTSPIPGMSRGKPAGVRCVQLTADNRCRLFGQPERPAFCVSLMPTEEMCGGGAREAFISLTRLERATDPSRQRPNEYVRSR